MKVKLVSDITRLVPRSQAKDLRLFLASKLKELRAKDISQKEMAAAIGISAARVSTLLGTNEDGLNAETAEMIALYLGKDLRTTIAAAVEWAASQPAAEERGKEISAHDPFPNRTKAIAALALMNVKIPRDVMDEILALDFPEWDPLRWETQIKARLDVHVPIRVSAAAPRLQAPVKVSDDKGGQIDTKKSIAETAKAKSGARPKGKTKEKG